MATKLVTFYSCRGPLCNSAIPATVILCVPWEKVAAKICPEAAGNQPYQYSYIEGELVYQCLEGCDPCKQWRYDVSYDDTQIAQNQILLGGDVLGAACKDCLGAYADQRAGNEVYVRTEEGGAQFLVTQHGCEYELLSSTGVVQSVFGRVGAVVAQANDYTWAQIDKTVSSIADIATKSHTLLTDIGVNTHPQIDAHLANFSNPHNVTKTQIGLGNVTDDAQLKRSAGDFVTFPNKAVPVAADVVLIEDSAAAFGKKYATLASIAGVSTVTSVFGRVGAVVAQAGDYNATQVGLGNVTNDAQLKRAALDFGTFPNKAVPISTDQFLIEDSAAAFIKKYVTGAAISGLAPVQSVFGRVGAVVAQAGDYNATQVGLGNVTNDAQLKRAAADFTSFANKAAPVGADVLLIEDSAAAFAKKNILVSSLLNIPVTHLTNAGPDSSVSAVFATLTGMSSVPAAGTYVVLFNAQGLTTTLATQLEVEIQRAGVSVAGSVRTITLGGSDPLNVSTFSLVTVTGVEAISVAFRRAAGGGTVTVNARSMLLVKVS